MVIKYSKKMKVKHLRLISMLGKNREIVAIARILAETIWTMPSGSLHPDMNINVKDAIKLIKNQRMRAMLDQLFS